MVSKLYEYAFTGAGVGGGQTSPFGGPPPSSHQYVSSNCQVWLAWGSMTRAALWLSQQSAYAPDAFLREPERDHPLFLSPSDINTLEAKQANRL